MTSDCWARPQQQASQSTPPHNRAWPTQATRQRRKTKPAPIAKDAARYSLAARRSAIGCQLAVSCLSAPSSGSPSRLRRSALSRSDCAVADAARRAPRSPGYEGVRQISDRLASPDLPTASRGNMLTAPCVRFASVAHITARHPLDGAIPTCRNPGLDQVPYTGLRANVRRLAYGGSAGIAVVERACAASC
jgi:hypothetical protein